MKDRNKATIEKISMLCARLCDYSEADLEFAAEDTLVDYEDILKDLSRLYVQLDVR